MQEGGSERETVSNIAPVQRASQISSDQFDLEVAIVPSTIMSSVNANTVSLLKDLVENRVSSNRYKHTMRPYSIRRSKAMEVRAAVEALLTGETPNLTTQDFIDTFEDEDLM